MAKKRIITICIWLFWTTILTGQQSIDFDNENAEGGLNGCLYLDGDDYYEVGNPYFTADSGTIIIHFWPDENQNVEFYLIGHAYPRTVYANRIQMYIRNNMLSIGMGNSHNVLDSIGVVVQDQWNYAALSWLNGSLQAILNDYVMTGGYALLDTVDMYDVGNDGNINWRDGGFTGFVDELQTFSGYMTPLEIVAVKANVVDAPYIEEPPPPPPPNPDLRTHLEYARMIWDQEWHPTMSGFEFKCEEFGGVEYYPVSVVEFLDTLNVDDSLYVCQIIEPHVPGTDSLWQYNYKYTVTGRAIASDTLFSDWSEPAIGYFMHGDFNTDWIVDGQDLIKFAQVFGQIYDRYEDLNQDGIVDGRDLILFANEFGKSWSNN